MDSPELEAASHEKALRGLARINLLSLTAPRVWERVRDLPGAGNRRLRVLDLACGGGDVAISVKERADRSGVPLEVEGSDLSPVAVAFARRRAERLGLDVRFFQHDALDGELPEGYDLIFSSLFLHHLSNADASTLLRKLGTAGRAFFVQDLLRTRLGYVMALAAGRTVTRSRVVRADGPRSVEAGFSLPEVRELLHNAGLNRGRVARCWPQRFTIDWRAE